MNRGPRGKRAARRRRFLIAGGGTGGHVYPGLAVAEALVALEPDAEVRFAGTRRGLEARLVPAAGWRLHHVPAAGFRGRGLAARAAALASFAAGGAVALGLLMRWRPAVVLGTGGYVSAAPLLAGRLLGCRTALQEQNAVPGAANRWLGRLADRIYLGIAEAAAGFAGRDCVVTGNPVRAAFADARPDGAPAARDPGRPLRLLVFGGSRGARTLNRALVGAAPAWRGPDGPQLLAQTGPDEHAAVAAAYADCPVDRARVVPYIEDMAAALAWADLVVCRAGAMTLAELAASGRPAVLVPFPHATDDHQLRNALAIEGAGAAIVLRDQDCDGSALVATVAALGGDPARLIAMARASAALARPRAAREIAADLLRLAGAPAPG